MKKLFLFLFALVVSIGTAWADKTVYLNPGPWAADNPVYAVWAFGAANSNPADKFITMTAVGGSNYYKAVIPDGYTKILFARCKSGQDPTWEGDGVWNQTEDITISGIYDNTLFTITGWGNSDYSTSFMNIALGGTASDSFHEGGLVASNGNDGNTGTRWGSYGGGDTEWFQVAWSDAQTFNTIKLLCENAMNAGYAPNLAFEIQVSDNGTDWTTKKHVWGKNAGTNEYITVVLNENVTAKYVRFQGVKKGQYGYTFYEFEVYDIDYSSKTLNSIEFSTYKDKTSIFTDGTIALSAIGKTADDEEIPTGAITWNNSTPTVGNVTNETFNALTVGTTTISATAGIVNSNEITFTVKPSQVIGSVSLPYQFFSATSGYGPYSVTVLDTDGEEYLGDYTLSWEGNGPIGAVISADNKVTFGAASGVGNFALKATSGGTSVTTPVYMVGNDDILTPPTNAVLIYGNGTNNEWIVDYNGGAIQDNVFTFGTTPVKALRDTRCVFVCNKDLYSWNADINPTEEGYKSIHFSIYSPIEGQKVNISFEQTTTIGNNHLQTLSKGWNDCSVSLVGETKIHTISLRNENTNADEQGPSIAVANIYFTRDLPTEGYYIVGTMNNWEINNNYKLTLNETAAPTVEYYFPSLALTTSSQFKVVYTADGTNTNLTWYPGLGKKNYGENGEIASDGNYVIFFRPNADGGDGWYEKVIYVTSMIDAGVDATTGAHILQGTWDADKFTSIDNMSQANSYDLTALTTSPEGTITTIQKNVLFICRADQNIAKNKVVANGDGTYTGTNIEILDYNEYNGRGTGMNTKISPITGPVALHRVLPRAGIYLTQVVPFDVAVPADANAYEATTTTNKSGDITITFTEVSEMKAGVPYLMHATNGGVHFNANSIDFSIANKEMTDAAFKATYNIIDPVPANTYVMPKGDKAVKAEFLTAAANSYIPAFRGYVELPAQTDARINVVFDDATGIHAATTEQLEGIFNIYSIDGKLVRQNTESKIGLEKGIYIINGKKVVIK
ncbi:MAG: discoidin domain-containing protein [Prevotella sp.]|nr:discoidin domain-containing protein [Prevotella sp.]